MKTPNFLQRFLGPTPAFEKTVQVGALILIAIIDRFAPSVGLSAATAGTITNVLLGIVGFAQFACKDVATFEAAATPLQGVMDVLGDLSSQFSGVADTINNQAAVHSQSLASLASSISTLAASPGATIVNLNPAPAQTPTSTKDAVIDALNASAATAPSTEEAMKLAAQLANPTS